MERLWTPGEDARLFVGFRIPDAAGRLLRVLQADLPGARWTDPSTFHVTLLFLGRTDPGRCRGILEALRGVRAPVCPARLDGAGFFRKGGGAVVWAGIRPSEGLSALRSAVVGALAPEERGPWRPHVTLGRAKRDPGAAALKAWAAKGRGLAPAAFDVSEFVLFESELLPGGARHTPRLVVRLG